MTLIALLSMLLQPPVQADMDRDPSLWLERREIAGQTEITAFASADVSRSLQYRMVLSRSGQGGVTRTRQGGDVAVAPGTAVSLSTLRVNALSDADNWDLTVELLDDGAVVARRSLGPALPE